MGYIRHHAIAVTTSIDELIKSAHETAKEIFGETVSEIITSNINGYKSFFVAPDGSKEGWGESEEGDKTKYESSYKIISMRRYLFPRREEL